MINSVLAKQYHFSAFTIGMNLEGIRAIFEFKVFGDGLRG